jgi:O-antigen ligase
MNNIKRLFSVFVITISIILIKLPLAYPSAGGLLFIFIGILWFGIQIWKYPEIKISKAYLFLIVLAMYLMIFAQYSKPIPITPIIVQKALIFLMLAILSNSSMRSTSDRILWENALVIFAILVSVWSVIEIYGWNNNSVPTASLQVLPYPQIAHRLSGNVLGHPNSLAGFLNFVWPVAFIRLLNTKQGSRKILWGIGLLLFSITIFYTNSRGALLGTFAGMLVIIVGTLLSKGQNIRKKITYSNVDIQRIIIILTSVSFLIILSLGVIWRTNFTGQALTKSFSGRGTIWQYSWQAIVESPIFGQGIAAFPISYTKFAQLPPGDFAPHAHNLWLQIGVDYGIIGLLFICIFMTAYIFYGIKKQRSNLGTHPHFSLAYLAGGSAFLAQQTVDFTLISPAYLVTFVLIFVLTTRYSLSLGEWKINRKCYAIAGGTIIGLIVIYQGIIASGSINFAENSLRENLANHEQWELLQKQICSNLDNYPDNALYKFECSQAVSQQMSQQRKNGEVNTSLLEQSLLAQQSGRDLNPYWTIQEANLAVLFWIKGDRLTALDYMKHAANAAPMYDLFWLNLGWMEEQLGNQDSALAAYTRALRINPLIARSTFVEQSLLISIAAVDLAAWAESEQLWSDWYNGTRHDRAIYDQDYWKGVIALSSGQTELAVESLEISLENGSISPYIAYAYEMNGQTNQAFSVAQDMALLKRNRIRNFVSPYELSVIASIFRKNGETDIAFELLSEAVNNIKTGIVYFRYYPEIYGEQILISDIF